MTNTRQRLKSRRRPARPVELPGGETVHVSDLTVGQLRAIDTRAHQLPEGPERQLRYAELFAVYALAEDDGLPSYPDRSDDDLAELAELLSPSDLAAIGRAVLPDKADAKN